MKLGLGARILISAVFAAGGAAGAHFWETERSVQRESESAMTLAAQVASQADGLAFAAREKGEADPLRWAANHLSQGNDPRIIRVSKVAIKDASVGETRRVLRAEGLVEITRATLPERSAGLRTQVRLRPPSFMGSSSRLSSDLRIGLFALGAFAIAFVLLSWATGALAEAPTAIIFSLARAWVGDSRVLLVKIGTHVREIIRGAQELAVGAAKSRDAVSDLRDRLHREIQLTGETKKAFKTMQGSTAKAEALALNLVLEVQQFGPQGKRAASIAEELHRFVQQVRHLGAEGEALVAGLESKLEPLVTDADVAYHSFEDVFKSTQAMDGHIRSARESLISHAKLIQGMQQELEDKTKTETASPAPTMQKRIAG